MAVAYYNEFDSYVAEWLRNLIRENLIPFGYVDERSIRDVEPSDVVGFTQCHFFAGIGGWSLALRLAGWPDDRPVWTGSCPCQPFSVAGAGAGVADERHLWPEWFRLLRIAKPPVVMGEQVEAAIRHGWLDLVRDDLEGIGYAFGAAGLPAACVGAPHIRQRLWFVADADEAGQHEQWRDELFDCERAPLRHDIDGCCATRLMGDTIDSLLEGHAGNGDRAPGRSQPDRPVTEASAWSDCDWIPCRDGKWRPIEPGTFPLAHGIPARVGRLRAYGNAIVPQVAAEVIRAFMECRPC